MLLGIATVPAIVYVGVGYVTRDTPASDFEFITYRDYVGVSNVAAGVRRPHRARHHVPRPAPAGAAADLRPPAHRRRLRDRQGRRDVRDPVRVLVPPQVVLFVGPDARERRRRAALRPRQRRGALAGAVAVGAPGDLLRRRSAWRSSSLTSRRIIAGAAIIGLFLVSGDRVATILVGAETVAGVRAGRDHRSADRR